MLVSYSDSEGEEEESAPAPPPAASSSSAAAPFGKRDVSLNALQRTGQLGASGAPAAKRQALPSGFFEVAPPPEMEPDASGADIPPPRAAPPRAGSAAPGRGWAGLSALLPPPSRPAAGAFASADDVLSAVGSAPRATRLPPPIHGAGASVKVRSDLYGGGGSGGSGAASSHAAGDADAAGGEASSALEASAVTESYASYGAGLGGGGGNGGYGGYGPAPPPELPDDFLEAASSGGVVSVSQDALRAAGASHAYQPEQAPQEVKIAASFWNRKTGAVEASGGGVSRLQKKKHQINSLAAAAQTNSASLAQMSAQGRKSKAATAAKYGW